VDVSQDGRWPSEYEYEIHYIPGTKNVVGDALSRLIEAEGHKTATQTMRKSENLVSMHVETQQTLATIRDIDDITHGTTNDHDTLHYSDANITFDEFLFERHPTATETLMFYRATPAEITIPINPANYMECPDFATLYKTIGDELRQKHDKNPEAKTAKEFYTWDVPNKLHAKISEMLKVQEDSKRKKTKLPKNSRRVCNTFSNANAWMRNDTYHIYKGLLYKVSSMGEDLLCVPDDTITTGRMTTRKKIVAETHNGITSIHLGENRTYYEIRRRVFWPGIAKHVHDYIRTCHACQRNKIDRQSPQGMLNSLQQPTRSGTHYSMDFVTHLPMSSRHEYTAIMVVVDRFSKRIWTIPTWDIANARLTAELFMKHIIYENGICIEIVSDRDSKFTSKMWQDFHAALGITLSLSSSRHQSTDGQTERAIAHIEELMRMNINYKQSNWVSLLPKIQFTINTAIAKATGVSPYYAERGRHPLTKLDMDNILRSRKTEVPPSIDEFVAGIANIEHEVQERLVLTREWQQRGDKKRRIVGNLSPGKFAYLSTEGITLPWDKHRTIKKLRQEFYGPFKILRQLGPVSFELKLPPQSHIHPVFHAHLLKATDEPGFAMGKASSLPNAADSDEYTVESLVDVRGIQGKERYLVKWSGYPYEECTWEPKANLTNCQKILQRFHRKRNDDAQNDLFT
jgi:transposase InsO family protein